MAVGFKVMESAASGNPQLYDHQPIAILPMGKKAITHIYKLNFPH